MTRPDHSGRLFGREKRPRQKNRLATLDRVSPGNVAVLLNGCFQMQFENKRREK
jgi:hypothetical protein